MRQSREELVWHGGESTTRPSFPCVDGGEEGQGDKESLQKQRRARKNEREKGRRQEIAFAFQQLMDILNVSCNKSDRAVILNAAYNQMQNLTEENAQLKKELEKCHRKLASQSQRQLAPVVRVCAKRERGHGPWQRVVHGELEYFYNRETEETSWTLPRKQRTSSSRKRVRHEDDHPRPRQRLKADAVSSFSPLSSSVSFSPHSSPPSSPHSESTLNDLFEVDDADPFTSNVPSLLQPVSPPNIDLFNLPSPPPQEGSLSLLGDF